MITSKRTNSYTFTAFLVLLFGWISVLARDEVPREQNVRHRSQDLIQSVKQSRLLYKGMPLQDYIYNLNSSGNELKDQENEVLTFPGKLMKFLGDRRLAEGDFDAINSILDDVSFLVPDADFDINMPWPLPDADADAKNIVCSDISVEDMTITSDRLSNQQIKVIIEVKGLKLECDFDWSYSYGVSGSGDGQIYIRNGDSEIVSEIIFVSSNFAEHPPNDSYVSDCNPTIEISDMDFQGGVSGAIANTFEGLLRGFVEDEIEDVVCSELNGLGTDFIKETLDGLYLSIEPWIEHELEDPLSAENSIDDETSNQLINFTSDEDSSFEGIINLLLNQTNAYLGVYQQDIGGPNGDEDLGINIALRSYLLDENRMYTVDVADLGFGDEGLIFDSSDMLTDTKMWITAVRIYGVDTFTEFDPLVTIGRHTLQSEFVIDSLRFEMDLKLEMKASSSSSAIIIAPDASTITEYITTEIDMNNAKSSFSFLLAIDKEKLSEIQLKSVLYMDDILSCVLEALHKPVEFTQMTLEISNIEPPTLEGFISPGLDRLVTDTFEIIFEMYNYSIRAAIPGLFDTTIKSSLNTFIETFLEKTTCTTSPMLSTDGFVDFRDLLLDPSISLQRGGQGNSPHGDLPALAYETMLEYFNGVDDNGLLVVNSAVIDPLTESLSGERGSIILADTFINESMNFDNAAGLESIDITLGNVTIDNINTVIAPFILLDPIDAYTLNNSLSLGVSDSPLEVGVGLSLMVDSDYLSMDDRIEFKLAFENATVLAEIMAMMSAESFADFPLDSVFDLGCWLSLIPLPGEIEDVSSSLSLDHLGISFAGLSFGVSCVECTSAGMQELPVILDLLDDTLSLNLNSLASAILGEIDSDITQPLLDSYHSELVRSCPFHDDYDETSGSNVLSVIESGVLDEMELITADTYEYFAVLTVALLESLVVVFAMNLESYEHVANDPLSAQNNAVVPEDVDLLDFNEGLASIMIDELKGLISSVEDINSLIGDIVLDDGILSFSPGIEYELGGSKLSMNSVVVEGLDSLVEFDILNVLAPQTFTNDVVFEKISLSLNITIDVGMDSQSRSLERIVEDFTISTTLSNVSSSLSMYVPIDMSSLGEMELGSLMFKSNLLQCALSTLYTGLNVTEFTFSFDDISALEFTGISSEYINDEIFSITRLIGDVYGDVMEGALPELIEIGGLVVIDGILQDFGDVSCPPAVVADSIVDFRDLLLYPSDATDEGASGLSPYGDLWPEIISFVDNNLLSSSDKSNGGLAVNEMIINPLTTDGSYVFEGDLLSSNFRIKRLGFDNVSLRIYDAYINNIDSVGSPTSLLVPISENIVDNEVTIGVEKPMNVGARVVIELKSSDTLIYNDVKVNVSFNSAKILLQLMALVETKALMQFPMADIQNIYCWIATILSPLNSSSPTLAVENLVFDLSDTTLTMECLDCSSSGIVDMVSLINESQSSDIYDEVLEDLGHIFDSLIEGGLLQSELDQLILDAKSECYGSTPSQSNEEYDLDSYTVTETESIIVLVAVGISISVLLLASQGSKYKKRQKIADERMADESVHVSNYMAKEKEYEALLNSRTDSLLRSNDIPLFMRIVVPIVVLINIGFFLSGHLSKGASVTIDVNVAGQEIRIDDFFVFSMAQSTLDMWDAGAKFLAVIIVAFSGIWPYTKQTLTLALWCAPPNMISVKRRGSILLWLDAFAKWSMIDIYLLVISLISFRISVVSPDWGFLPDLIYSVDLLVIPKWGLYANMTAQIISQVSSHFIIYYHRCVVREAEKREGIKQPVIQSDDQREVRVEESKSSVNDHLFASYASGEVHTLVAYSDKLIGFVAVLTFTFFVCGTIIASFQFRILGLLGVAVDVGSEGGSLTDYSLFSIVGLISDQAKYIGEVSSYVGLYSLCALFVITTLVVPVIQMMEMLYIWFVPMKLKTLERHLVAFEICQAWQYSEVYLISILAASLQLGEVSTYFVNDFCGSLDYLFAFAVNYGLLELEDSQCFYVDPALKDGFYLLLIACIFLWLFSFIVMKIANIVFEERREELIAKSGNDSNDVITLSFPERFFGLGWLLERCEAMDVSDDEDGEDAMGVSFGYPVVSQSMVGKDIQVNADPTKDEVSMTSD